MITPKDMPDTRLLHAVDDAVPADPWEVEDGRLRRIVGQTSLVYTLVSQFAAPEDVGEIVRLVCDRFDDGVRP